MRSETRLALAGCGAVGGAFVEIVGATGPGFRIESVLVRDRGKARPPHVRRHALTTNAAELLDAEADIVVEALGGVEPAAGLARATLGRGAAFVTANKTLVATHGPELAALAARHGGALGFDAAVGGGVPVVRTLRDTFAGVPVRRVSGILNGTANFLLTRLEEGSELEDALAEARVAGYAEADPSRDLDGRDVADKAAVVAWVAWKAGPASIDVVRTGLPPDAGARARSAVARGRRLRLVADVVPDGRGGARAEIGCREVPAASPLGRTEGVANTVVIETAYGDYTLTGPGAGGPPTALAVFADVRAAAARAPRPRRPSPA